MVEAPDTQLFPGEINRVSLYRKTVRQGERLRFKNACYWCSLKALKWPGRNKR